MTDTPAEAAGEKTQPAQEPIRLQKVLSQAGVASRRAAEDLMYEGRVEVNGEVVTRMGTKVDPATDVIRVDGDRIVLDSTLVHLVLNKPAGVHSTMVDDMGRPCVGDLIPESRSKGRGLFHVGRLDVDTEGLLIITNDGELGHRLMHPSYQVPKTYMATVNGVVSKAVPRQLLAGVELDDGVARADEVRIIDSQDGRSLMRMVIHEGRNRIVRRMFAEVGYPVERLVRTRVGGVALGDQRPGSLRKISSKELAELYRIVGM